MSQQTIRKLMLDMNVYPVKVDLLVPEILKLIREIVPEENKSWGYGSNPEGWNSCRKAILDRLNEMERGV